MRVNQDCVDIIVEYAAATADEAFALRLVSAALSLGVTNRAKHSTHRFSCCESWHPARRWPRRAAST